MRRFKGECAHVSLAPLLKLKCAHSPVNIRILSSTGVLFTVKFKTTTRTAKTQYRKFETNSGK